MFDAIIGHNQIKALLERSFLGERMGQSFVFSGPEAVGKFTLALEWAWQLTGTSIESVSVQQERFSHPDIRIMEPTIEIIKNVRREKGITVEAVREARKWLALTPYQGLWRVLIIRDAHRLTEEAQNALLKTLEEPPARTVIILVTHESGRLLPTVLSRCHAFVFQLVDSALLEAHFPQAASAPWYHLGRPGLCAWALRDTEHSQSVRQLWERVEQWEQSPLSERLAVVRDMATDWDAGMRLLAWKTLALRRDALSSAPLEARISAWQSLSRLCGLLPLLHRHGAVARLTLEAYLVSLPGKV